MQEIASKPQIMVCNEHDTPLIWTFAFPYAEYFCMAGNHVGGMLGTGYRTDATPELKALQTLYKRRWGQLRRHIALGRYRRTDCDKCEEQNEDHNEHLTDDERRRSVKALAKLEQYATEVRRA